jgi:hypothetical protein
MSSSGSASCCPPSPQLTIISAAPGSAGTLCQMSCVARLQWLVSHGGMRHASSATHSCSACTSW